MNKKNIKNSLKTKKQENQFSIIPFDTPISIKKISDIQEILINNGENSYYEYPIEPNLLLQALLANAHHQSAFNAKTQAIYSDYISNDILTLQTLQRIISDFLLFGNAYIFNEQNRKNQTIKIHHVSTISTRKAIKENEFIYFNKDYSPKPHKKGVFMLSEYTPHKTIYGIPAYISALQSIWLNENATIFRNKFYENGAHSGYIILVTGNMNSDTKNALKKAIESQKGIGNFKNMLVFIKDGDKDSLSLKPVGNIATDDDFLIIKQTTREDILSVWRVPHEILSVMQKDLKSAGDLNKVLQAFFILQIMPIREIIAEFINSITKKETVKFKENFYLTKTT